MWRIVADFFGTQIEEIKQILTDFSRKDTKAQSF